MIHKSYTKTGKVCRVTFEFSNSKNDMQKVALCGDFNAWSTSAHMMKKKKNGCFSMTISLKPGKHLFKYLINESYWENDNNADGYMPNSYGTNDSIITL